MKATCTQWAFILSSSLFAATSFAQSAGAGFEVRPTGMLVNDGIRIPAYVVSVEDAMGDPGAMITPGLSEKDRQLQGKIPAAVANRVAAYWTFDGWFLVPRGWRLSRAEVGADNGSLYEFVGPNGAGVITARDSGGGCVGCALSLASPFFPDARRESASLYGPMDSKNPALTHTVKLGTHTVAYRRRDPEGQDSDGIAYYSADGDYEAFTYEVSLPAREHALATAILDWRLPPPAQR